MRGWRFCPAAELVNLCQEHGLHLDQTVRDRVVKNITVSPAMKVRSGHQRPHTHTRTHAHAHARRRQAHTAATFTLRRMDDRCIWPLISCLHAFNR